MLVLGSVAIAGLVIAFAFRGSDPPAAGVTTTRVVKSAPLPGLPLVAVPTAAGGPAANDGAGVAQLEALVRAHPDRADAQMALGAARLAAGDAAGARRAFEAAVALGESGGAVGQIVASYDPAHPDPTLNQLDALGASPLAAFEHAVVELWAGHVAVASDELRSLRDGDPESFYGVKADDLLHPTFESGYPFFVPATEPPANADLGALASAATAAPHDVNAQLQYGAALLSAGRRREARAVFARALTADPGSVEAQVASAVAAFSKDQPAASVGLVGPLVRDHPGDPSPRFHLALMLIWMGLRDRALAEFAQVARDAPATRLGQLAAQFNPPA